MRVIEKKRPPLMNPKRWLIVTIIAVAALIISCILYYRAIQQPLWQEKEAAIHQVMEQSEITEIQSIHKYIWDEASWIVSGATEDQQLLTVVIRKQIDPFVISSAELLNEDEMKSKLQLTDEAAIKKIQLGFMEDQLIWEVQLKKNNRYYYAFYRATDGQFIDEYQMLNKTER